MEKLAYEFSTIVIVAPLVAIMKHLVEQLKRFGITETAIYRLYIDWGRGGGKRKAWTRTWQSVEEARPFIEAQKTKIT